MSATQSWLIPVSLMRQARFRYTSQLCFEFVVTTNRFGWMASKLSSRIIRATFLPLTCTPRRRSSTVKAHRVRRWHESTD